MCYGYAETYWTFAYAGERYDGMLGHGVAWLAGDTMKNCFAWHPSEYPGRSILLCGIEEDGGEWTVDAYSGVTPAVARAASLAGPESSCPTWMDAVVNGDAAARGLRCVNLRRDDPRLLRILRLPGWVGCAERRPWEEGMPLEHALDLAEHPRASMGGGGNHDSAGDPAQGARERVMIFWPDDEPDEAPRRRDWGLER